MGHDMFWSALVIKCVLKSLPGLLNTHCFFVDRKALKVVGRIIGLRNAETHNSSTDGHNLTCFCLFGYSKSILVREGFFSSMCLNSCLKREDNLEKIIPLSNVFISFNFGRI